MRILYVSDVVTNPGGAGAGLSDQMEAQRRLGNVVSLCHDHLPERVRLFRPDLLHFHTVIVNTGLGVLEWAQQSGIPHCLTLHDFWPFCANRMMLRSIADEGRGEMCPTCDGQCENGRAHPHLREVVNRTPTIVNQEYQAARMQANGIRVDAVIECGIDTEFWRSSDLRPAEPRVVSTSAWWECHWKGAALIDRAFAGTGVTVHRIGGVPRQTVRDVLQGAAVFLFPSSYPETWGLSLLEAMACGCACVASAVDGPRVMIENGFDGVLVPPRDEGALREVTLALLGDRSRRERMGRRAAEKVRARWNLLRYGRDHKRLYQRLMQRAA